MNTQWIKDRSNYVYDIRRRFTKGETDKDGTPIGCQFCEEENLDKTNYICNDRYLHSYTVVCLSCGKDVAYNDFGVWIYGR